MKTCPDCLSEVKDGAQACAACGARVSGKACPECAELVRTEARRCRHCGHSFARDMKAAGFESFEARAELLPTLIFRGRLIPQDIRLTPERILITTYGYFWLSRTDDDIPWEKIAGYHYHSGLLRDSVEIQTRGQKSNSIGCLSKAVGPKIKDIIERMKE